MPQSIIMRGADIKLYLGGKLYTAVNSISYTIDYSEQEIYGIDSAFPQEIAVTRVSVQGSVGGFRIKSMGGLQGSNVTTKIQDILHSPYISLRIKDRHTDADILWIPQIKVTNEQMQIRAKGVVQVSFNFKGIMPFNELDLV